MNVVGILFFIIIMMARLFIIAMTVVNEHEIRAQLNYRSVDKGVEDGQ